MSDDFFFRSNALPFAFFAIFLGYLQFPVSPFGRSP